MAEKIKIQLVDGPAGEFDAGTDIATVLKTLAPDDRSRPIGARWNGKSVDLSFPVPQSAEVAGISLDSPEGEEILRHTAAHIMAQAVKELYPGTQVAIGPTIENGFYYDFDTDRPFTPEDLGKITKRIKEIIKRALPVVRSEMPREEALAFFAERQEKYKVELINDLADEQTVSLYTQGDYVDLCRGPHLPMTSRLRHFKLLSVAGAYWRGE